MRQNGLTQPEDNAKAYYNQQAWGKAENKDRYLRLEGTNHRVSESSGQCLIRLVSTQLLLIWME